MPFILARNTKMTHKTRMKDTKISKMRTASTLLMAVAIAGGVSCQHVVQDIPVVGVSPTSPSQAASTLSNWTNEDEEELMKALQFDDHVIVTSPIEVGELLCDSLLDAEDAAVLSFVLLQNETIVAEKSSYTVIDGDAFTDGIGRKIWTGIVADHAQGEDESVPRTVSMTWGDVCDPQTFLLKVTKRNTDGTSSIVKTIPCFESTTHTCLVEVTCEFEESGEAISPPRDSSIGSAISNDDGKEDTTDARPTLVSSSSNRRLQDDGDTVIDVMVLYSSEALVTLGDISPDQMETSIIASIAQTNEAFVNSEVALSFHAVHIGPLPYEQTSTTTEDSLRELTYDVDVVNLRDTMGADLVQMVGYFNDGNCGRAYLHETGDPVFGTSVVGATCLDDNTVAHEFGHNLGCLHNREDASYPTGYAHGVRYCSGENAYRTIMSYSCGSPYIFYFSNPDVSYLGKPTGTATENNARSIRNNMVDVSYYRDRVTAPTTPAPTNAASTTPAPTNAASTEYTFIGCYGDDTTNRVLSGAFVKADSDMTIEVCAAFCTGYPYFGTEFGQECFCGIASDDPSQLGEASCNYDCAGDASQTCGGRGAISVYENDLFETPPGYLGCWQDSKNNRVMDVVQSDSSMTNDLCGEICSFYPFYGTQYGLECWCGGESTDYTTHGDSDACTVACAGDASQTCGGSYAINVFEHDTAAPPPGYLGCWKDSAEDRIMGVVESSSSMTNDLCEEICSSYAFYGTQYGQECWCGDASTDYTTHGESDSCNMGCAGGTDTVCGGNYAVSVWEHQ